MMAKRSNLHNAHVANERQTLSLTEKKVKGAFKEIGQKRYNYFGQKGCKIEDKSEDVFSVFCIFVFFCKSVSRCQRLQEETYFFALGANMTSATEVIKWSREQHGKVEAGNNPMMRILETWSY